MRAAKLHTHCRRAPSGRRRLASRDARAFVVALFVAAAVAACTGPAAVDHPFPSESITVGDQDLTVWVADEPEERHQGLRGVEALPRGVAGLLFSWRSPAEATFTMKGALIPLDIWWFDGDGALIGSTQMDPCSGDACPTYPSPGPIGWALETPLGELDLSEGSALSTTGDG